MKNYQSRYHLFALLWVLCITLVVSSCKKPDDPDDDPIVTPDPCTNVTCNWGHCVQGTCNCDYTNWEGTTCSSCKVSKYIGTYTVDELCNTTQHDYTASIYMIGSDCDGNFYFHDMTHPVLQGHVNNVNGRSFTLNAGTMGGLSGNGTINADNSILTFTYEFWDGGNTYNCAITMTRQ